jgi:putative ABC transport system substrate-binding protein
MIRRRFVICAAGMMLSPAVARAQLPARAVAADSLPRIGALMWGHGRAPDELQHRKTFARLMASHGYAEGKDIAYEWAYAGQDAARLPSLAAELVRMNPRALLGMGSLATRALSKATSAIPIVGSVGDPVTEGYTETVGRPVGNVTGVSDLYPEIAAKMMQLLKSIMPELARFGIVAPRGLSITDEFVGYHERAARRVGVEPVTTLVTSRDEIVRAYSMMRRQGIAAAYTPFSAGFFDDKAAIARLALESHVAAVDLYPGLARAGGLLSFSAILEDMDAQMAQQLGRILGGAPVREIPFHLPTKYWIAINRKTATALGLSVPLELVLRADRIYD